MPAGTAPRRVTSNMKRARQRAGRRRRHPDRARAHRTSSRRRDRGIALTLYGVRGNTDIVNYAPADYRDRTVEWTQVTNERARVTVNLRAAPYGYLVVWEGNAMVLKLRGRPADRRGGIRCAGLTIAVDPGHPPIGATGPTGSGSRSATLPDRRRASSASSRSAAPPSS